MSACLVGQQTFWQDWQVTEVYKMMCPMGGYSSNIAAAVW